MRKQVEGREALKFITVSISHSTSDGGEGYRYLSIYHQISAVYAGSAREGDMNPRGVYSADKDLRGEMESRLFIHGPTGRGSFGELYRGRER